MSFSLRKWGRRRRFSRRQGNTRKKSSNLAILNDGGYERVLLILGLRGEDLRVEAMAIRSMTGYSRVVGKVEGGRAFTLSLKSVNHRFLDLQFRLPSERDGLEMQLRRVLNAQ